MRFVLVIPTPTTEISRPVIVKALQGKNKSLAYDGVNVYFLTQLADSMTRLMRN